MNTSINGTLGTRFYDSGPPGIPQYDKLPLTQPIVILHIPSNTILIGHPTYNSFSYNNKKGYTYETRFDLEDGSICYINPITAVNDLFGDNFAYLGLL